MVEGRKATPVIFLTAQPDRDLRRAVFELDIHAFLEKPINPSEFLVHAMHIVDAQRERADMAARLKEAGSRANAPQVAASAINAETLIDVMLDVAAMHDPSIVVHHNLSSQIAMALAREVKLTDNELETLRLGVAHLRHRQGFDSAAHFGESQYGYASRSRRGRAPRRGRFAHSGAT